MPTYAQAHARSLADPDGFWAEAAAAIDWARRRRRSSTTVARAALPVVPRGRLNTCHNALDRHVDGGPRRAARADLRQPGHRDRDRTYTYRELRDEVARFAGALRRARRRPGDRVVVYMPMVPEAVVAMLACARLGAVHSVVFGGFAPHELAAAHRRRAAGWSSCRRPAGSRAAGSSSTSRCSTTRSSSPSTSPSTASSCSGPQVEADHDRAAATSTGTSCDRGRASRPAASRSPRPTRSTSSTPRARPASPRASCATTAATRSRCAGACRNVYDIGPGDVFWAASDVGWVVGHSYIVYAPLLSGAHHGALRGQAGRHAGRGRVLAGGRRAPASRPCSPRPPRSGRSRRRTRTPRCSRGHDISSPARRCSSPASGSTPTRTTGRRDLLGVPVIDHWWQTETGWPIAANPRGLEPLPVKPGSPDACRCPATTSRCWTSTASRSERGHEGSDLASGCRCRPARCRRCGTTTSATSASYLTAFAGYYLTGDGGYVDDGRLPVRHGPHRRRHQRRRPPAVDRSDGGGASPRTRPSPSAR